MLTVSLAVASRGAVDVAARCAASAGCVAIRTLSARTIGLVDHVNCFWHVAGRSRIPSFTGGVVVCSNHLTVVHWSRYRTATNRG